MFFNFSITHADVKVKRDTLWNLSVILLISFLPLVLGVIAVAITGEITYKFVEIFFSGQLYFYAISLCGTLFITSQLNNHERNLGMRIWSGAFVICCAAFMSLYIGQSSLSDTFDPLFHGISSTVFLFIAVFLSYRVKVLDSQPPQMPEEINRARTEEMTKAVEPKYD